MEKFNRKKIAYKFCKTLVNAGFNFVSGVPCAAQKYFIANFSISSKIKHIPATRESEAIGIAAGAYLAGKKVLLYMQNSGLMNSISDITSLLISYRIPLLFLVTWRGAPGEDAPQHLINGKSMINVLKSIGLRSKILTKNNMENIIKSANQWLKTKNVPFVILIIRGVLK